MDKLRMQTANKADENFKKLAAMFPNAVTETINENGEVVRAIDKDVLMQEISCTVVDGNEERYQFTWPDKKKSVLLANAPINKTLRPVREDETVPSGADSEGKPYCSTGSVDFDTTENLYIEGDNLEVLKLLQETYLGKIKMIYIDPPYNTGNDFVYNDEFGIGNEEWNGISGNYDADGNQLVGALEKNTEANGRFHTDWLNMIYPRLKLAKDLLRDDGVIFISIDDNEVENLKKVCGEVFGEGNFVAIINWKGRGGRQDSKYYAAVHEYILCYAKQREYFVAGEEIKSGDVYPKYDKEKGRYYKTQLLRKWGSNSRREDRPNLFYPITAPDGTEVYPVVAVRDSQRPSICEKIDGRWRHGASTMEKNIKNGLVEFVKQDDGTWIPYEKIFAPLEGEEKTKKYTTWIDETNDGAKGIKDLFGSTVFDYPKSPNLLVRFLKMAGVESGDIILDFFSGSATTAHAVMQLNAEDGGHRKFIMVQLPEKTDEKSEAYKAGYQNICEIGKERIRRAGTKINNENEKLKDVPLIKDNKDVQLFLSIAENGHDAIEHTKSAFERVDISHSLDTGFRVLKCDTSNMKDVYYNPAEYEVNMFSRLEDNIKEDRTPEDLLFQVMLDLGVLLSSKIEETTIAGKKVFNVEDNYLIACFDSDVSEETIKAIAKQKPYYFVMRDSSMASDSVATNFDQIFATYSPDTVRKVL
jgi:adenine-specific DNA-methyltransferase